MEHEKLNRIMDVDLYRGNSRDEAALYNGYANHNLRRPKAKHLEENHFSPIDNQRREYENEYYDEPAYTKQTDTRGWHDNDEDFNFIPQERNFYSNGSAFYVPRSFDSGRQIMEKPYEEGMLNEHSPRRRQQNQQHKELKTVGYEKSSFQESDIYHADNHFIKNSRNDGGNRKRQTYTKFISIIPTWNKFERERSLPDRIELRMRGMTPKEKPKRSFSIPDLCRVKMTPVPYNEECDYVDEFYRPADDIDAYMSAPEFETEFDYKYDHDHQHLHYHSHKHEHLKEMYISQYTHYFDLQPGTPKSHIAGWKVDIEPQGIPHKKSRMCVLKNPLITGRRKTPERPKSAPPSFSKRFYNVEPDDEDVFISEQITVEESRPALQEARPPSPSERRSSLDTMSDRFGDMTIDSEPLDYPDEASSFGYAPSDDTSDTSSAFGTIGRSVRPQKFTMSQPRLLNPSAEFPGIRNLEKIRKKRQSMGSCSTASTGSISAEFPSPTNSGTPAGYGFCIALTAENKSSQTLPREKKVNNQMRETRYYTLE